MAASLAVAFLALVAFLGKVLWLLAQELVKELAGHASDSDAIEGSDDEKGVREIGATRDPLLLALASRAPASCATATSMVSNSSTCSARLSTLLFASPSLLGYYS